MTRCQLIADIFLEVGQMGIRLNKIQNDVIPNWKFSIIRDQDAIFENLNYTDGMYQCF